MNLTARTLFWVGNGGFWDEATHWSLSSGGIGGECPPTPLDNVFFDLNSFSTAKSNWCKVCQSDAYIAEI